MAFARHWRPGLLHLQASGFLAPNCRCRLEDRVHTLSTQQTSRPRVGEMAPPPPPPPAPALSGAGFRSCSFCKAASLGFSQASHPSYSSLDGRISEAVQKVLALFFAQGKLPKPCSKRKDFSRILIQYHLMQPPLQMLSEERLFTCRRLRQVMGSISGSSVSARHGSSLSALGGSFSYQGRRGGGAKHAGGIVGGFLSSILACMSLHSEAHGNTYFVNSNHNHSNTCALRGAPY